MPFCAPDYLHTDQGKNFESTLIREICRLLGIDKTRTTAYHPQSDGFIERFNRTFLSMLSMMVEEDREWDTALPLTMMAYRSSIQKTTGETPFYLTFGREIRLPIDVVFGSTYQYSRPAIMLLPLLAGYSICTIMFRRPWTLIREDKKNL